MSLREKSGRLFQTQFGTEPTCCFRAPGRVNLIGEHTDYNDGFVLPCAIDYETVVVAGPRTDSLIVVVAADYDGQLSTIDLTADIAPDHEASWSNYVRGMAWVFRQQGYRLTGANLVISGDVPQGAGLSSSASLEVVIGTALAHLSGLKLEGEAIALAGQQAENDFVGMRCGIMDQFISALGQENHALLIDCRSLDYRAVPIPAETAIVIANSNVRRGLVDSEYNTRRRECEAAAAHFGVPALRDVPPDLFVLHEDELDEIVARRARHVITENARTEAAAEALSSGDLKQVPPIDALVEIIGEILGEAGGVRMTGGGFGGCVVALAPQEMVPDVEAAIVNNYPAATGLEATIYICQASPGVSSCS
jgi:galactokinase